MTQSIDDLLRSHTLTRALAEPDLARLVAIAQVNEYEAGAFVFRESQPRRVLGIVTSGRIAIQKGRRGQPKVLGVLGAGDSYGEGSVLDEYPHSTTAVVLEPTTVIEFPREPLLQTLRAHPGLFARLALGAA
ncbi:MAG TPA: cyclic nucleotide-binding domain-containing protein, partial [Longimicrobiales bacterium]|nr:cyclic nucleotide-binding domain-containing protein [Longimicrobiales bacterium]